MPWNKVEGIPRQAIDEATNIAISSARKFDTPKYDSILNSEASGAESASWRLPILPAYPKHEILWHYTSTEAVLKIIESHEMWASAATMLNDPQELDYGFAKLHECVLRISKEEHVLNERRLAVMTTIEDVQESFFSRGVYVLCASAEADDLSQWRGYGGTANCAIGLSSDDNLKLLDDENSIVEDGMFVPRHWTQVLYKETDWAPWLDKLARFLFHVPPTPISSLGPTSGSLSLSELAILNVVPFIKASAYKSEAEARLFFVAPASHKISFRASGLGIIPYVRLGNQLPQTPSEESGSQSKGNLAINAIMLGPTTTASVASPGLRMALDANGYERTLIPMSSIKYR